MQAFPSAWNSLPYLLYWAHSSCFPTLGSDPLRWDLFPDCSRSGSAPFHCSLLCADLSASTLCLVKIFLSLWPDLIFRVPRGLSQETPVQRNAPFQTREQKWILFFFSLASGPLAWGLGSETIVIAGQEPLSGSSGAYHLSGERRNTVRRYKGPLTLLCKLQKKCRLNSAAALQRRGRVLRRGGLREEAPSWILRKG